MKGKKLLTAFLTLAVGVSTAVGLASCDKSYNVEETDALIAQLQTTIDGNKTELNGKIAALEQAYKAKDDELQASILANTQALATLKADYDEKVAELTKADNDNKQAIADLETKYKAEVEKLTASNQANANALAALKTDYESKMAALEKADKDNATALATLKADYESKVKALDQADKDNASALAALKADYDEKVAELTKADNDNKQAIADLDAKYKAEIEKLTSSNQANAKALATLKTEYESKVAALEKADKDNATALANLKADYESKVVDLQGKIDTANKTIADNQGALETAIATLKTTYDEKLNEVEALIDTIQSTDTTQDEKIAELVQKVIDMEKATTIVSVAFNDDGDLVITFADGSTQIAQAPETHVHSFGEWVAFTASDTPCEQRIFYRVCSSCSQMELKQGASTDHAWVVETTEPTCQAQGFDTKTCGTCGAVELTNYTPIADHAWAEEYSFDNSYHWIDCDTCDAIKDKAEHSRDNTNYCKDCLTAYSLVSFYNDGVLFDSYNIILNDSVAAPTGTPLRADENGYRYTFSHWSIEENGAEYNFTNAITKDLNLYAVFNSQEIVYAINYYDTYGVEHDNITSYTVSTQFTLLELEKENFVFNGWKDKDGNKVTSIKKGTFGTLELYATWSPIEYAITYDLGYRGAVNGSNPTTYNAGDSFSFASATYDEYHTFVGWYLDENFVNEKSSISVGESGAITLYAKWDFNGTYISTVSELQSMAYNMSGAYELQNDIDLTNETWTAIGDSTNPFAGYFNGAGYSINGKTPFGIINGVIKNLQSNVNIGDTNNGIVEFCKGNGLFYRNNGQLKNCSSIGYLRKDIATGPSTVEIGGMVLYNYGIIENCVSNIKINIVETSTHYVKVGGIAYSNEGSIINSYSDCDITIKQTNQRSEYGCYAHTEIGGINVTSSSNGVITNSFAIGSITVDTQCLRSGDWAIARASVTILGLGWNSKVLNSFAAIDIDVKVLATALSGFTPHEYMTIYKIAGEDNIENSYYSTETLLNTYDFEGVEIRNGGRSTSGYNLLSKTFLRDTIGFDENIWILQDGQYPKLWFEGE